MSRNIKFLFFIILGLLSGLLLERLIPMLYFVGLLLSFFIIFMENQHSLRQTKQNSNQDFRFAYFVVGLIGYLMAGIIAFYV